ncbi:hypothetical protein L1049_020714 [Liquidambar formosana]|uniref:Uncharacterized protein n=1 Tax=Liquidambar formosana TaxID=63359 RepID=A0AAP0XAX4_LIQFO
MQFSSLVLSQIRSLLQTLNDSNSDSVFQELCQKGELVCAGGQSWSANSAAQFDYCSQHVVDSGRATPVSELTIGDFHCPGALTVPSFGNEVVISPHCNL